MVSAAEDEADKRMRLVGRELVAITKTLSLVLTPVAEVQFTALVVEAVIVPLERLQKPNTTPAMVEPFPPTTRLVVLAVPLTSNEVPGVAVRTPTLFAFGSTTKVSESKLIPAWLKVTVVVAALSTVRLA